MIDTTPPGHFKQWIAVNRKDDKKKARVWNPSIGRSQDEVYHGTIRFEKDGHVPSLICDDGVIVHAFAWFYMVEILN